MVEIRKATLADLDFILALEVSNFLPPLRSSKRSLKHSILSPHQQVHVAFSEGVPLGAMILRIHKTTLRIFSIAVEKNHEGRGLGRAMVDKARQIAIKAGCRRMTLEADAANDKLINWYEFLGFTVLEKLPDYYGKTLHAYRMLQEIQVQVPWTKPSRIKNYLVTDQMDSWLEGLEGVEKITAMDFITDPRYQRMKNARIFNFCSSYEYQTLGYYVSLLASARNFRVIPNVITMEDFTHQEIVNSLLDEEWELVQTTLNALEDDNYRLKIFFGHTLERGMGRLAREMYRLFESPLLVLDFIKQEGEWQLKQAKPLPYHDLTEEELGRIEGFARAYFLQKRFSKGQLTNYRYDLAILVDPEEINPPSDSQALAKFEKAANRIGFYTEIITKKDFSRIPEFDALFIRTTTNVKDYTYQFSRFAYAQGLVVIDDPWSISQCSNKLFLQERMARGRIPTPRGRVFFKGMERQGDRQFPMVVKQPDSAFSRGVHKVKNEEELQGILDGLFEQSDLIIGQEFLPSEYDWRIGVLDKEPLYACRYYMAKDHWQIVNYQAEKDTELWGRTETLPLDQVPRKVVETAVAAASLIGDGLYGVDFKEYGSRVYVIEINDNPNIDSGIEDLVLKEELYHKIMAAFMKRLKKERSEKRWVSN